jgi:serine/threonine protein kinase
LKPENIFISHEEILRIGDFGISRMLNTTQSRAQSLLGTPFYLSPEMVANAPYDFKHDMWSLGITLYEMCTFQTPFQDQTIQKVVSKIMNNQI